MTEYFLPRIYTDEHGFLFGLTAEGKQQSLRVKKNFHILRSVPVRVGPWLNISFVYKNADSEVIF